MTIPTCLSSAPGIVAAELTIDGLALCCFNHQNRNDYFWEVASIRNQKHSLTITIVQMVAGGNDRVILNKAPVPQNLLSFDIRLDTGTNALYNNFQHGGCQPGNFNRASGPSGGNDRNDLRWMIDFAGTEVGHGRVTRLKPRGGGRVDVTLATLHHSLLFTRKPSDHPVRLVPRCSSDPLNQGVELGYTNEKICGLMMAPTPGNIVFTGFNVPERLSFNAQTSYRIEIINEDEFHVEHWPGLSKGDFHFFYDIIEVDGQQKELWAVLPFRVAPDGDCNPTFINATTLQPLIQ
jgi:hypothetical protein